MIQNKKVKFGKTLLFAVIIFATFVFVSVGCASGSTAPEKEWSKTFGNSRTDVAWAVQQTTDGGYILAGYTKSYGSGDYDFWLVKTDSNGNEQWNKTFGGTAYDRAYSVQQTTDGGYILAGYTGSYGAGDTDIWLVKTDSNGNEQWNKTLGSSYTDRAYSVQQTTDGGYILAGYTESYGDRDGDFWLVKTDSSGYKQWDRTFGGTSLDRARAVQQTSDGGYILAGYTGYSDFWLVKTDSNGNEQWNKTFGGTAYDRAYSVQQTSDGGYILAGYTESYGAGDEDFWLVKTDSNGNEQWNKAFGGIHWDKAYSVQQTSDGGYILAGYTESYGSGGGSDFWLVKTDSNGNEQWNKAFGGSDHDIAHSVQQTTDGGYILAGYTESYGAGNEDFWLVKVKGEEPELKVAISTDKTSYTAGDTMRLGLDVRNPLDSAQRVDIDIWLELSTGGTFTLIDTTVTLPAGLDYSNPNFKVFTLPSIPAGTYTWHAQLSDPVTDEIISEDTAEWRYAPTKKAYGETVSEEIAKEITKTELEEWKIRLENILMKS